MEAIKNTESAVLKLTDAARDKVQSLMRREHGDKEMYLRISVVGGGCSGLSYKMSFEEAPNQSDASFEENSVALLLDPKSQLFLQGLVIDFEDGLNGAGFTYNNPKAKKSCGCGTSFAV
ncbi:MAG: iron-sulfur cluster assembly accessory protein [Bradymonadales bacterium]|nr:MAG: iron-sulfur cluster assembly accessory protein [Bradymonadales bacterium]